MNTHQGDVHFDVKALANLLEGSYPEIQFCLLLGSAQNGVVKEGSDLDIAVYVPESPSLNFYSTIEDSIHKVVPSVRCDIGFLERAEPIFRYEALKGKLLFARDMEEYASFFSKTCRDYERQMIDYERQHTYRLEAKHAV